MSPFLIFLSPQKMLVNHAWGEVIFAGDQKGIMEDKRQTLTIIEAAKILGIGRNQAYEAARRGEIPTIKIGKRILVPVAALERKLQEGK